MPSDALRTAVETRSVRKIAVARIRGLEQSFILLLAGGLASAVNALFSLIFLHLSGVVNYSSAAPLLTIGSVAATASVGLEYMITVRVVATNSLSGIRRLGQKIALCSLPTFALIPVIMLGLHYHSTLDVALAIAIAIGSFAQAIPNAILLAYGRLWTLGLIAAAQAIVRVVAFIPFAHREPVTAALIDSLVVTIIGGSVMVWVGVKKGNARDTKHRFRADAPEEKSQTLIKTFIGPLLFAPFVLPVWLAKATLTSSGVARLSVATFLASGVLLVLGPITSSAIPHVVDPMARKYLRHARVLCMSLGVFCAVVIGVLGPITVNLYFSRSVLNLGWLMLPLAASAPGWALVAFGAWVGMAQGRPAVGYLIALASGLVVQIGVASFWHTVLGLAMGPMISLAVVTTVMLILGSRWPKGVEATA